MRAQRKRTYKQIEDDNKLQQEKVDKLLKAKEDLQQQLVTLAQELEYHRREARNND